MREKGGAASKIITASPKPLTSDNAILLSLIFGVIFAGLGVAYLGFADPHADPLALLLIIFLAFSSWLGFLIVLRLLWKSVAVLSFASHTIVTFVVAIISAIVIWPLSIATIYSAEDFSTVVLVAILNPFAVAIIAFVTYRVSIRSLSHGGSA